MSSISAVLNAKAPASLVAPVRPTARRPARSVVTAAGGSRQDKKAEYVKKQDEMEAVNPGGSAGGSETRDKKKATGAYGATNIEENSDDGQIQKSDHGTDMNVKKGK